MKRYVLSLLILGLIFGAGCAPKDKLYTPSEAEKKLAAFCLKEGETTIFTRIVGKTLWVYIPFDEPLFTVKPLSSNEPREKKKSPLGLLYLGGQFDEQKNFSFEYDIVPDVISADKLTYTTSYNEKISKKRQLMYTALQESVFNMTPKDSPDFVVIVIAELKTGVGIKSTLYLSDLKQYMTQAIPAEEYSLREWNLIFGSDDLANDRQGRSLAYEDVDWKDFLVEQIKRRINFIVTQSDFPPKSDPDKAFATAAADTLRYYPFTDYQGVYLYNMRAKREMLFNKVQLKTFEEKSAWEGHGKLTTIHFDMNNVQPEQNKK
ncbi:MAG: hypothetical protein HQL22_10655 [Candidatus Omnitrophica bacterium]|nr:hypothetical protein [Candidatus Omnitrophota bacterium]